MMGILCKIFGHTLPRKGWWGDGLYGRVTGGFHDGTGRSHYRVDLTCPRCGDDWTVARFHGSQVPERGQ